MALGERRNSPGESQAKSSDSEDPLEPFENRKKKKIRAKICQRNQDPKEEGSAEPALKEFTDS